MKESNKKKILLTIYLFSIIFMLIGFTFSYFTAQTRSSNNALSIKSGKLKLSLNVSPKYTDYKLIPTDDEDIMKAYNQKCLDDAGSGACLAYDIVVTNDSVTQDVVGKISFTLDHIENLKYLVLDENGNIYQEITSITDDNVMPLGEHFIIEKKEEPAKQRKFVLVIWLSNLNQSQDYEKGGTFKASVNYNSVYGQSLTSGVSWTEGNN